MTDKSAILATDPYNFLDTAMNADDDDDSDEDYDGNSSEDNNEDSHDDNNSATDESDDDDNDNDAGSFSNKRARVTEVSRALENVITSRKKKKR